MPEEIARAQCYRCGMARRPEDPSWWWESPFVRPPYHRHVEDHYCIEALGRAVQELQQQVAALAPRAAPPAADLAPTASAAEATDG